MDVRNLIFTDQLAYETHFAVNVTQLYINIDDLE